MAISFERINRLSMVDKLALVNFLIFVGLHLLKAFHSFLHTFSENVIISFLACPSSIGGLLEKPWAIVSYSFIQYDPTHALLNILWLIWVGSLAARLNLRQSGIFSLYLCSAIIGGLSYVLVSTLTGIDDSLLLGSSASVISLAVAVAVFRPSLKVSIPLLPVMPVVIPVAAIVLAEACMVTIGNPASHFAHIGGIASGFLFGFFWRHRFSRISLTIISGKTNDTSALIQKIRTSGFESLSPEERDSLYQVQRVKTTDNS